MSINAISALTSAYNVYVVDYEHEEIKRKLASLGIKSSGSKTVDKTRLEAAQKEKELERTKQTSNTTNTQTAQKTEKEEDDETDRFVNILRELHVSVTGETEKDYKNAINMIKLLMRTETREIHIDRLNTLKSSLDRIMSNLGYATISIPASEMQGASALGELNKVMMLGSATANK